jgi:serine/threonine protein kinase
MAPEQVESKNGHSFEADLWALGVILFTLLIGYSPFVANDTKKIYENIKNVDYYFPSDIPISPYAMDLISLLLVSDPNKRLKLDQVLEHDFFKSNAIPLNLPLTFLKASPTDDYIK